MRKASWITNIYLEFNLFINHLSDIPLPVVTKSVEDGSFQCLFFCIALFFTKRENNNEMRNSQDLEGKFV